MKRTLVLLGLLACSAASAQTLVNGQLPAGSELRNQAFITGTTVDGTAINQASNEVVSRILPVSGVLVTPDAGAGSCGQTVQANITPQSTAQSGTLTYTVRNQGNLTDTFTLSVQPTPPLPALSSWQLLAETDGVGGPSAGDTLLGSSSAATGATLTLTAEQTATVYLQANLDAPTGNVTYGATLNAVSSDGLSQDQNNIGCVTASSRLNLTMTDAPEQLSATPDTRTFTHVLTNTSNRALQASEIGMDFGGSRYPAQYTASIGGVSGPSQPSPLLAIQQAIEASGQPLAVSGEVQLTGVYQVPAREYNGTVSTQNLIPFITVPTSDTVLNERPQAGAINHPDVIRITANGEGQLLKRQVNCGQTETCIPISELAAETYAADTTSAPCNIIKYGLFAENTGTGPLQQVILRDQVPANTTALHIDPTSPALVRTSAAAPWTTPSAAVPLAAGSQLEIGFDLNGDGEINRLDVLNPGERLSAALYAQVQGQGCSVPNFPDE